MPVDKEPGRFNVQLLGNVITDFSQVAAALPAGAAAWFVAVFNTLQMARQRLATSTGAFGFGHRGAGLWVGQLFDLSLDGRQVGVPGFFEHVPLQRRQGLALGAEADALVIANSCVNASILKSLRAISAADACFVSSSSARTSAATCFLTAGSRFNWSRSARDSMVVILP